MDDIITRTETVPQKNSLLDSIAKHLQWARLKVKAEKCRSLVIFKGIVQNRTPKIDGETITPIKDKDIKYLRKVYS